MRRIESPNDDALDPFRAIKDRQRRADGGRFVVESPRCVSRFLDAVQSGWFEVETLVGDPEVCPEVMQVADGLDKYDADKLAMGLPPDAGLGINPFLNYAQGEEGLLTQAGRGLDAINEEIDQNGTDEEKECRDYVLYEEAGSSEKTFQNGWKRDCDPVTGKVAMKLLKNQEKEKLTLRLLTPHFLKVAHWV